MARFGERCPPFLSGRGLEVEVEASTPVFGSSSVPRRECVPTDAEHGGEGAGAGCSDGISGVA
jgi:hypothetical protein